MIPVPTEWIGTAPQWLLFFTVFSSVLLGAIKIWPQIRQQNIDFTAAAKKQYEDRITKIEDDAKTRITEVEAALAKCRQECKDAEEEFRRTVRQLEDELHGQRRAHLQEQITLVSTIIDALGVDNPMLTQLLRALERGQRAARVMQLTGVKGDAQEDE